MFALPYGQRTATSEILPAVYAQTNDAKQYLYGCSHYEYFGFHCDPIQSEFESSAFVARYTMVSSASREPDYVQTEFGQGVRISTNMLESIRARIIDAYNTNEFSVYVSVKPDNSSEEFRTSSAILVAYRNGVYPGDLHNAGWQITTAPSSHESTSKLHFTVFNSNGTYFSSPDVTIPADRFSEILGSFDGRNVRIFVNGELKGQTQFDGTYLGNVSRSNSLNIAGDAYCSCQLANGIIDEVRYYNYSLAPEEVGDINAQQGSATEGLVGYWKFDGDLRDYSGYGNDLFYNTMISSMAFAPDGRLFYNEKNSGNIRIMVDQDILDRPFASISDIHTSWDQGLLGLAIDSRFNENHFVYAYYNYKEGDNIYGRVVRFTDADNVGTNEAVILDRIPVDSIGFHTGGAIMFNPADEKLYVTVGDGTDPNNAQDIDSLYGKVLRINRDGTIPDDNPFPNSPVYTYGHRNSYGIAFDDKGTGIYTEPGSALYDEVNLDKKGGNYGWPTIQPPDVPPELSDSQLAIKPLRSYYHALTPTPAVYYDGDKYPELKGKFIFGTLVGSLYAIKLNEDGTRLLEEWRIKTSFYPSLEVVSVAVSPDGYIYFGTYDIFRLDSIDLSSKVATLYPVGVNATNVDVSEVTYQESAQEIALILNNRHDSSSVLVKIPFSLMSSVSDSLESAAGANAPYSLKVEPHNDYNLLTLQMSEDAPGDLKLTIGRSTSIEAVQSPTQTDSAPPFLRPSGCLIATAAFGSELSPQVQYLRNFREEYILSTVSGSAFMNAFNMIYYSFSPQVADYERQNPWLQNSVKTALYPLFGILGLSASGYSAIGGEAGSIVSGIIASTLIGAAYFSPMAALARPKQKRSMSAAKVSLIVAGAALLAVGIGISVDNQEILMVSTSLLVVSLVCFSALLTVSMTQRLIRWLLGRKQ